MFTAIHHVAIICSDYSQSKKFYTDILGFKILREVYRSDRDSWKLDLYINEATFIELFSFPNAPDRPSYPEATGLRHIALSTENIADTIQKLSEKNIHCEPLRIDAYTNKKFTFFADPDNLPIEVYEL